MSHQSGSVSGRAPAPDLSIVHVVWSGGVGGIERLVGDLARVQAELGWKVGVAFGMVAGPFATAMEAVDVEVLNLMLRSGYDLRPARLARAARVLSEWDVVHLHGLNLPLAIVTARSNRPIVFTDHGSLPHGGRRMAGEMLKRRLLRRFLHRRVGRVVANSRHTAQRTSQLHGVNPDAVRVVYNGVSIDPGDGLKHEATEDRLVAAFVGRLVAFKRVDRLLQAASQIPSGLDATFLIVGDGPLEEELRSLARRLSLEGRVRFLGVCGDLRAVLKDVDVLVHPSRSEPFGLSIVEGCALGLLPIVFADGGGALEVLPPDGLTVDDVPGLVRALTQVAGSEKLSTESRRARSAWALHTFPIARTAESYGRLYREVAS
jgi:glycosyltransferase involved in cell wall biosynthesis